MSLTSRHSALWGLFIGDAIAMPVHWYYNPMDIKKDYGSWLTGYESPKDRHPSSIMHLSSTGGSGRSSSKFRKDQEVIGNVILHDKRHLWGSRNGTHYHHGLKAGENTLNATTAYETFKNLKSIDPDCCVDPEIVRGNIMEKYITFMTTPKSHNDTYAESSHRAFFGDWIKQDPRPTDGPSILKFCKQRYNNVRPGQEDAQIPCIGSLVIALPWILHYSIKDEDTCAKHTLDAIKMTHPAPSIEGYIDLYARLLHAVLNGADLKAEVLKRAESPVLGTPNKRKVIEKFSKEANKHPKGSEERLVVYQEAVAVIGMACYLNGSMPSMLFLAHEFADDLKGGLLTNANCGGENTHRGGALGALLGAQYVNSSIQIDSDLKKGLVELEKYSSLLQ